MIKLFVRIVVFTICCFLCGCNYSVEKSDQKPIAEKEKQPLDTLRVLVDILNFNSDPIIPNMILKSYNKDKEVVYYYSDDGFIKASNIRNSRDCEKQYLISKLELAKNENKNLEKYLKILKTKGMSIKYLYGKTHSDTCQIILSTNDIGQILYSDGQLSIDHINKEINRIKLHLPTQIDEFTVWFDYSIIDNNVSYLYEIDESVVSMDYVMENYELIKSNLSEQLLGVDNGPNDSFVHQAKALGLGMSYVYFGSITNKRMEIVFKNEELL